MTVKARDFLGTLLLVFQSIRTVRGGPAAFVGTQIWFRERIPLRTLLYILSTEPTAASVPNLQEPSLELYRHLSRPRKFRKSLRSPVPALREPSAASEKLPVSGERYCIQGLLSACRPDCLQPCRGDLLRRFCSLCLSSAGAPLLLCKARTA